MADVIIGGALVALGFSWLISWALCRAADKPTQIAAPAPDSSATPARATCSVALCDDEPSITITASGEKWDFCQEHGEPYLVEGLAA